MRRDFDCSKKYSRIWHTARSTPGDNVSVFLSTITLSVECCKPHPCGGTPESSIKPRNLSHWVVTIQPRSTRAAFAATRAGIETSMEGNDSSGPDESGAPTEAIYSSAIAPAAAAALDALATATATAAEEAYDDEEEAGASSTSGVAASESHEQHDSGAEALFVLRAPPKKKCRKLELKPPDFAIPEFGGGSQRKRYPLEFKLNAIRYAQSVVEGGRGPGGTVGITYATKALGISDKATLSAWIRNRATLEKEVQLCSGQWAAKAFGAKRVICHLSPTPRQKCTTAVHSFSTHGDRIAVAT